MPVSSYVVTTHADHAGSVRETLSAYDHVLIDQQAGSVFAVAVATETERESREWGHLISNLPGVESASLVYHNFEDLQTESHSTQVH